MNSPRGMEAHSGQLRTSEGTDAATAVISLSLAEQVGRPMSGKAAHDRPEKLHRRGVTRRVFEAFR